MSVAEQLIATNLCFPIPERNLSQSESEESEEEVEYEDEIVSCLFAIGLESVKDSFVGS